MEQIGTIQTPESETRNQQQAEAIAIYNAAITEVDMDFKAACAGARAAKDIFLAKIAKPNNWRIRETLKAITNLAHERAIYKIELERDAAYRAAREARDRAIARTEMAGDAQTG